MKSKVTVIIPCYNDGIYIVEALDSIYNQSVQPEKIIIVDDGSSVTTKEILGKLQHPLLEIIYQENQGVSVARNRAIQMANTEYILNLDADDYYESTFIEKAIAVLNKNQQIGAVSSYNRCFNHKGKTIEIIKALGGTVRDFIVINNGRAAALFRKKCWETVGGFDEKMLAGYEDWEFWIAITQHNWSVHIIPEVLSHYRVKKKSRDTTALRQHDFELRNYIYNKHKELYKQHIDFYVSELLRQNSLLRSSVFRIKKSREFTLGYGLLSPIRFIKKKLFKK